MFISYDCSELIKELKMDIEEFGGNTIVAAWINQDGLCTNYDFIEEEMPIQKSEIAKGEFITKMTMNDLLVILEKQNEII